MKAKSYIVPFLVVTISIIGTILLIECVLRVVYTPVKEKIIPGLRSGRNYKKHEIFGWVPKKNVTGIHIKKGSFETTFKTNSRGLRDREYTLEKSKDVMRIVVTGDSFTWGYGVNDHEVYTEVLESMLNRVEVINLGVTAFNLDQEFLYLKLEGLKYDPDIVIVSFCLNDIVESLKSIQSRVRSSDNSKDKNSITRSKYSISLRIKKFLRRNSILYQFIIDRINTNKKLVKFLVKVGLKSRLSGFDELDINVAPALKSYPKNLRKAFERTKSQILEISNFLRKKKIRFILALIPSLQTIDKKAFDHSMAYSIYDLDDFDLLKPYCLLEEFSKASDIEIMNPVCTFQREQDVGKKLFLNNDTHFNRLGHKLFACELFEFINHNAERQK